jgi:hypothetical protein
VASILLKQTQPGEPESSDAEIKSRFKEAIDPTVYQRKEAPPKRGNLIAAQKLFSELGITDKDWPRQFCSAEHVSEAATWRELKKHDWSTSAAGVTPGSMSSVLQGRSIKGPEAKQITLHCFLKTVLPITASMAYLTPDAVPFYAFVTGGKDTYPFLQWHHRGDASRKENLVSWYTYDRYQKASTVGLVAGEWTPVASVVPFPHMWSGGQFSHINRGYLFVIPKARDSQQVGGCLFPSLLASRFHPVKSTIEEFNRQTRITGEQDVVGVAVRENDCSMSVKVLTKSGTVMAYTIHAFE